MPSSSLFPSTPPAPASPGLSPLELATGLVVGTAWPKPATARRFGHAPWLSRTTLGSADAGADVSARAALLAAVRAPLAAGGPCLVSFSGGMDSSLVLAAAARVAREEGLAPPVPITWRIPDAPRAAESGWQDAVVRELGLSDWIRLEATDDLDWVGPVALDVLRRHGVLFPANLHMHDPLLARARGGALLTGVGGDQLFGLWRWATAAAVRSGRVPLRPSSALAVARSRAPETVRRRVAARRSTPDRLWLRPDVAALTARVAAAERASEPADWTERVAWQVSRRHLALGLRGLALLGHDHDAAVIHPLLEPGVVAAVAAGGGRHGFSRRSEAVATLFGDLLPRALHARRSKATFGEVFTRGPTRAMAATWDGGGVDTALVDPACLRAQWTGDPATTSHALASALLLQNLALAHD
jgi:asparagine synthase (glutamine-hydrolysing)